jgi:23S rRNA (cytidine1920-2'-O)/16S rRNA (cytidine1409-2'-O)-methyltransferase
MKERLDLLLVRRGLVPSRQAAAAMIMAGRVQVDGARADKPGVRVPTEAAVTVAAPPHPFASRGGVKLAGALDDFQLQVAGLIVLDVGASTGGFTDCLLQRGAAQVLALDVGRGQLAWSLRRDSRVALLEGINARYLEPASLPAAPAAAVIDVSFISLKLILPAVARVLPTEGWILALVKPQFEAGRGAVGRGGIVRDAAARRGALEEVALTAAGLGLAVAGLRPSRLAGADGNQEYFLHVRLSGAGLPEEEIRAHALAITQQE